ncbi:hypothetical protein RhiirA5_428792 [Rhizophagus irregularis]|uniref:Uncharacterized protein n=1 Tax=Rhizophagus irregularis TaxID=588596 RepID=A0A2N0NZM6_9GLOM|nr:hypothetical protein RhiirA5_428792 [Rhizophagus irregularis]
MSRRVQTQRPESVRNIAIFWTVKRQFQEAENYRNTNNNSKSTIHPQAIYTSRLLNPYTKDLSEYIDENTQYLRYVDNNTECHKFRVANEIPIEYFKSNSPDCSRYSFNYQIEIKIEMTPNITEVYLDGLEIIKYYPAEISSLFLLNEQTTIEKEHVNFNVHTDITTLATPNTIALGIFTNIYLIAYVQDIGRKLKSKYELIPFVSGRTKNFTLEERIQNIENLLEEYYLNVRIF